MNILKTNLKYKLKVTNTKFNHNQIIIVINVYRHMLILTNIILFVTNGSLDGYS